MRPDNLILSRHDLTWPDKHNFCFNQIVNLHLSVNCFTSSIQRRINLDHHNNCNDLAYIDRSTRLSHAQPILQCFINCKCPYLG